MPGKYETPRGGKRPAGSAGKQPPARKEPPKGSRKKKPSSLIIVLIVLMIMLAVSVAALLLLPKFLERSQATEPTEPEVYTEPIETEPEPETVPETTVPVPESVVTTASVGAVGDLLMHGPIFLSQYSAECNKGGGNYDFSSIFQYIKYDLTSLNYAVGNLETTFGGDNYPYQGNPAFNCPDPFINDVIDAGFDMLLTANNHSADTTNAGILRTIEVIRSNGLANLGSQLNDDEPKYAVVDVNGIRLGMVCYTWALNGDNSSFSLNGGARIKNEGQMNYFPMNNPGKMYQELEPIMEKMKEDGAEATIMFIHWGIEYTIKETAEQRAMAQKLCDMGFDVIVGGHPHVVEPMALLESTVDPEHKTVCIYSLGNSVSNQRVGISSLFPSEGYTEDGVLFTVTFEKYSDGKVYLRDTDVIPTWVNKFQNSKGKIEYNILPLTNPAADDWGDRFQIQGTTVDAAKRSLARTNKIVGEGLETCKNYLEQAKIDREEYYYDLAFFPERFATEPEETEAPVDAEIAETEAAVTEAVEAEELEEAA